MLHKFVILIEPLKDWEAFEERWPDFLRLVEAMPGLRREASSRVEHVLFGEPVYERMHELFFDDRAAAEAALSSPTGQAAGRLLQQMTGGRMQLFFAEHHEDDLPNILKHRRPGSEPPDETLRS